MPSEEENKFLAFHFSHIWSRADFTYAGQHLDLVGKVWAGTNLMDVPHATQMLRGMRERERGKKNIHTSRIQLHRECANLALSVDQKPWPAVRWKTVNARYHLSGLCLFFGIIVFGAIRCNWDCSVSA